MSVRPTDPARPRLRHGLSIVACSAALALGLTACAGAGVTGAKSGADKVSHSEAPKVSKAQISANVKPGAKAVHVDRQVKLTVAEGTLTNVVVKYAAKRHAVQGALSTDKTSWTATGTLEPGSDYVITASATDAAGIAKDFSSRFHTQDLTLDQQTYPSFSPLAGETVGVGMPVIFRFDVDVQDKKAIEKHLHVSSTPAQPGAFHWISDKEVHWRPKVYWQPGTDVTVKADINSVSAGNGIYGQKNRKMTFHVGRSMISKVNMKTHKMKVFRDGKLLKTMPITTGKDGFTTRSGVKVIIEKFRHKRMNSETIGIDPDSADGYDLDDVEYAMRVTYSGEFVHAAPWSVGSQGHANVSHGCTGLSTADARWLYEKSIRGDVVDYTGTSKWMTLTNGFGDWNESFAKYGQGSALA